MISLQFNVCFSLSFDDHGALVGPPWYDFFLLLVGFVLGIVSLQISNSESTNSVFFFSFTLLVSSIQMFIE